VAPSFRRATRRGLRAFFLFSSSLSSVRSLPLLECNTHKCVCVLCLCVLSTFYIKYIFIFFPTHIYYTLGFHPRELPTSESADRASGWRAA
jgi:hypothetical protein